MNKHDLSHFFSLVAAALLIILLSAGVHVFVDCLFMPLDYLLARYEGLQ